MRTLLALVLFADFNRDGKADLVAVGNSSGSYAIYLGNGDGSFGAAAVSATGMSGPFVVVAADLNGDSLFDLVMGSSAQAQLGVALGKGDGSFNPVTMYTAVGAATSGVAVGDLNRDGHVDIVSTINSQSGIGVLLGNGDGSFRMSTKAGSTTSTGSGLAMADLDGDQNLDLVVGTLTVTSHGVNLLFGNGDGTFRPPLLVATGGSNQQQITIADPSANSTLPFRTHKHLRMEGQEVGFQFVRRGLADRLVFARQYCHNSAAVGSIRVSTDLQAHEEIPLAAPRAAIEQYCALR